MNSKKEQLEQRIIKEIKKNIDPKFLQKNEIVAFRLSSELKADMLEYLSINNLTLRTFVLQSLYDRITQKEYAE